MARTDRAVEHFTPEQRIWLMERDLDDTEHEVQGLRRDLADFREEVRTSISRRLNWLVGLGFSLLLAVVAVLLTVIVSGS